jgi:bifunctional non-homologous end joining protein LigD
MLPRIQPIAPTRIQVPFNDPEFIFELKHDGFRAVAYVEGGTCQFISRKNIVYKSFAGLATALAGLKVQDAILDGELVCLDNDGRSQFNTLMRRRSRDVLFYTFDCLWLDGQDLRPLALMHRKRVLRHVLSTNKIAGIFFADYVEEAGVGLYRAVCERDCEGIVAKHRLGPYTAAPMSWFKIINPNYSQHRGRREMFDRFRERRTAQSTAH